jgi:hypothetical protein
MSSKYLIQRAIDRLKEFAGMPVPEIVQWHDGKPDFRAVDPARYIRHYRYKLCAICGTKLGLSCYWIGGEASAQSHYFTDGPMHRQCAELSISLCPFLTGTRQHFRGDDIKPIPEQQADRRPERMFLLRGFTAAIDMQQLGPESSRSTPENN